jgi:LDH2 family malate/lactate/ureidoglycolate dehydrogenase
MELPEFHKRIDDFIDTIKNLPLRPNFDEIFVPGEIEANRVKNKMQSGVPLDSKVIESFEILSKELNIKNLNILKNDE